MRIQFISLNAESNSLYWLTAIIGAYWKHIEAVLVNVLTAAQNITLFLSVFLLLSLCGFCITACTNTIHSGKVVRNLAQAFMWHTNAQKYLKVIHRKRTNVLPIYTTNMRRLDYFYIVLKRSDVLQLTILPLHVIKHAMKIQFTNFASQNVIQSLRTDDNMLCYCTQKWWYDVTIWYGFIRIMDKRLESN